MTFPFPFLNTGLQKPGPLQFGWHDEPRVSTSWASGALDFAGCAIGLPNPFRWVVVCASMSANQPINEILVNGLAAEIIANHTNTGGSPDRTAAVARLLVPAGSTCDVKLQTASAASSGGGVCVFTVTGGKQEVYSQNSGTGSRSFARPAEPSVTLYMHTRNSTSATSVPGLTQISNVSAGGGNMACGYLESAASGTFSHSTYSDAAAAGAVFI